jgi:hypothetical protein
MHKYEEQKVPCGGIVAQGISCSNHTIHLVCMFDVAVQSRCRKIYAVQSLERSPGEDDEEQNVNEATLGRTDHASSREYASQTSDHLHSRASVALRTVILGTCSPTLSVLVEDGIETCCLQRM